MFRKAKRLNFRGDIFENKLVKTHRLSSLIHRQSRVLVRMPLKKNFSGILGPTLLSLRVKPVDAHPRPTVRLRHTKIPEFTFQAPQYIKLTGLLIVQIQYPGVFYKVVSQIYIITELKPLINMNIDYYNFGDHVEMSLASSTEFH
eukprot:Awhi_evm2s9253